MCIRDRGWEKLPYAVVERPHNGVRFVDARTFESLSLCDGQIDLSPVSYTHLDVYKRQRQDEQEGRPHRHARCYERHHRGVPRGHAVLGQHVPVPVSYTHLDVYKRQPPKSAAKR